MARTKRTKWRRHTLEFKRQVVERMKTASNILELARELDLQPKLLYTWKNQLEGRPEPRHANLSASAEERKDKQLRAEIDRLKIALAEKQLQADFFKSALRRIKAARRPNSGTGEPASTPKSAPGRKLRKAN